MNAVVLASSRRIILVWDGQKTISTKSLNKASDLVVGDQVVLETSNQAVFIKKRLPRTTALERYYRGCSHTAVANLDHLFLISAPEPSFNSLFIDRVIVLATLQRIDVSLVINKTDLGIESLKEQIAIYQRLGIPLLEVSALQPTNLKSLEETLFNEEIKIAAFVGNSGVGKSTIFNALVPTASQRTGELNKLKMGRQTTTAAQGFIYCSKRTQHSVVLVDLPGMGYFGLGNIEERELRSAFSEFPPYANQCPYRDCSHFQENGCAVRQAVIDGQIAESRYASYLHILAELKSTPPRYNRES